MWKYIQACDIRHFSIIVINDDIFSDMAGRLLAEYVLFASLILVTLLRINAARKFGTFFAPPGI